jgi:hypothetical protein
MGKDAHATYPPLNTLKPIAPNVWIVDGPVIRFGFAWLAQDALPDAHDGCTAPRRRHFHPFAHAACA